MITPQIAPFAFQNGAGSPGAYAYPMSRERIAKLWHGTMALDFSVSGNYKVGNRQYFPTDSWRVNRLAAFSKDNGAVLYNNTIGASIENTVIPFAWEHSEGQQYGVGHRIIFRPQGQVENSIYRPVMDSFISYNPDDDTSNSLVIYPFLSEDINLPGVVTNWDGFGTQAGCVTGNFLDYELDIIVQITSIPWPAS